MKSISFKKIVPDNYVLAILCTVLLANIAPCRGDVARGFHIATNALITLLFFLHGAKLSREGIVQGLSHWRLQALVLCATFVLFPVLGMAAKGVTEHFINPTLAIGLLFVGLLPSTVQSSIAFTSVARGNVAAAVCSASASNLLGIFITPFLASVLISGVSGGSHDTGGSLRQIQAIATQLLAPFVLGHLSRPLTAGILGRHKKVVGWVDRSSILFVVYTAFSAAVVEGLWRQLSAGDLLGVLIASVVMLVVVLVVTTSVSRALKFSREDETVIVFCGSKKSLASGVPMASVLFAPAVVGPMIVPLILFHQIQLMVCAILARRYAEQAEAPP